MSANLKKRVQFSVLVALLVATTSSAHALGLWQAYEAALQNDPVYRGAKFENAAGQENKALGRSALLPSMSASYSQFKNRADYTTRGLNTGELFSKPNVSHPAYTSVSSSINLRQPLVNFDGLARYKQGVAQALGSDASFSSRTHDLMLRVLSAYIDVLFASDQLTLITAQRDTYAEQRRVNDRTFSKGEGTRTEMLETQAKLDAAEVQVIEARDNLANAKEVLAGITGKTIHSVDGLAKDFAVKPLQPNNIEAWQNLAQEKNPELQAQKYSIEAAMQEVNRNRAGHFPKLDLVASYTKGQSETLNTNNTDTVVRSIGIQLSVPLYSGGYVNAASNQALANAERAKADLETRRDRIMQELRKQFSLVQSSVAKVDALQKAVESSRLLIQATQQSIKGGVRINLDLLNARQQYYAIQRDLAQAKYSYLVSNLRLRMSAGVLESEDMRLLAAYFSGK